MPFFVEIPNVAVVPVKDPNSPITISEVESDFAPVHDVNVKTPATHKRISQGLRLMNPPSGRIPEGLVVLPLWFFCSSFSVQDQTVPPQRLSTGMFWLGPLISILMSLFACTPRPKRK